MSRPIVDVRLDAGGELDMVYPRHTNLSFSVEHRACTVGIVARSELVCVNAQRDRRVGVASMEPNVRRRSWKVAVRSAPSSSPAILAAR